MRTRNIAETTEWQDDLYELSFWETASTISVRFILTVLLNLQPLTDGNDTCLSWQPINDWPASGLPANKWWPASELPANRRRPASGLPANKRRPASWLSANRRRPAPGLPTNERRHTWELCSLSVPPRTQGWSQKPYGLCKETYWRRQNYLQTKNSVAISALDPLVYVGKSM